MNRILGLVVAVAAGYALWRLVRRVGHEPLRVRFPQLEGAAVLLVVMFFLVPLLAIAGVTMLVRLLRGQPVNQGRAAREAARLAREAEQNTPVES